MNPPKQIAPNTIRKLSSGPESPELDSIYTVLTIIIMVAAVNSAYTGKDTEKRQLRAYVHPNIIRATIKSDNFIDTFFSLKNYGQTPAIIKGDYACLAIRKRQRTASDTLDIDPI